MKREQLERVKEIVDLYLSKANKEKHICEAAGEGITVAQMLVDFEGELPGGSGYKHELVSKNVDRLRQYYITHDERYAERLIGCLAETDQHYLLAREFYRRRVNDDGERYTRARIAVEIFQITDEEYKYILKVAREHVFILDQSFHRRVQKTQGEAA